MSARASTPITRGAHHVGLTVPNLEETGRFFMDTLGYRRLGGIPDYPAAFSSDGTTMITLWRVKDPAAAIPFDRKNVIGLHHLAIVLDGQDSLETLFERLDAHPEVRIEFAPEPLRDGKDDAGFWPHLREAATVSSPASCAAAPIACPGLTVLCGS